MGSTIERFKINAISDWLEAKGINPPQGETYESFSELIVTHKQIEYIPDAEEIELLLNGVSASDIEKLFLDSLNVVKAQKD